MQLSRYGKYTFSINCPINSDLQYQKCVPNLSFACVWFYILAIGVWSLCLRQLSLLLPLPRVHLSSQINSIFFEFPSKDIPLTGTNRSPPALQDRALNIPGVTGHQASSALLSLLRNQAHLDMHRRDTWKLPCEQKGDKEAADSATLTGDLPLVCNS